MTRQNRALLISLAKATEARYATNQAKGPDVFRAQTFASEFENRLIELRQERASAVVRLNTLLNQASETPRKLRYRFKIKKPPAQPDWDEVLEERPLIKALSDHVTAADHRVKLAMLLAESGQSLLPKVLVGLLVRKLTRLAVLAAFACSALTVLPVKTIFSQAE